MLSASNSNNIIPLSEALLLLLLLLCCSRNILACYAANDASERSAHCCVEDNVQFDAWIYACKLHIHVHVYCNLVCPSWSSCHTPVSSLLRLNTFSGFHWPIYFFVIFSPLISLKGQSWT